MKEEEIPPRAPGVVARLSTAELWRRLMEQPSPGEAIVGLKRPGSPRGAWRGKRLILASELADARDVLRRTPGVETLHEDGAWAVVRLSNEHAVAAVRGLPVFDYIHPRYFHLQLAQSGCDQVPYESSSHPGPPKQNFLVNTVTGGNPLFSGYTDYVPWSFVDLAALKDRLGFTLFAPDFHGHRIPAAWRRVGGGTGVLVGVVDTGIFHTQLEVLPPGQEYPLSRFATGNSANRTMSWIQLSSDSGDQCGHGTLSTTTAVGPMNDVGAPTTVTGAAYGADLASAQVGADVVMSGWGDYYMTTLGIRYVVCGSTSESCTIPASDTRHRVVSMAFGDNWTDLNSNVAEEIFRWFWEDHVVFIGAAGTTVCMSDDQTLFPANMFEVLPVSCVDPRTGQRTQMNGLDKACKSGSSGVAGVWGPDVLANGKNPEDIWKFGGSSSCVGTVAGIAALVWASHPDMTRDTLRERLRNSGHLAVANEDVGFGVVDALVAVGGLGRVQLTGDATALPGQQFHIGETHTGGEGRIRYEWTDATCNGECRWDGSKCTGSCPLVGSCQAGLAHPYCPQIWRTASGALGGTVKTKLALVDESSPDQSDDVARLSSSTFTNCVVRSCAGRCGWVGEGCGSPPYGSRVLYCGPCSGWYGLDVTYDANAGSTLDPAAPRQMVSFASDSQPRVYSLMINRHVRELTWSGSAWKTADLNTATGAPSVAGASLAGFASGGTDPRVYYASSDGHIHELAWSGNWVWADLTAATGAPVATLGALEAFAVGGTLSRVYYLGAATGHLYELSWTGAGWGYTDLNGATGAPAAVAGSALAGFAMSGNSPRLYYVAAANNHVIQVSWNNGWSSIDASPGVAAAPSTPLNAYAIYGTLARVHFLDGANHVRELAWTGTDWQQVDVTAVTGSPAAVPGSALAGFAANGSDVRIYFQSANDNHLREISWSNGWYAGDLTQATGTPAPKTATPLTGFALSGTSPHIYSLAYNASSALVVRELAWY